MKEPTPKGYVCFCGQVNLYPFYVFAHWRDILKSKCEKCARPVAVCAGIAAPVKRRKEDPSAAFPKYFPPEEPAPTQNKTSENMPLKSTPKPAKKRTRHFGTKKKPAAKPAPAKKEPKATPPAPPLEKPIDPEPPKPVIPEHREDIQAQYKFTGEEVSHMERELRGRLNAISLLEDQKKAAMKDFALRIQNAENEVKILLGKLDTGEETRPMRAAVQFDAKRGMKVYLHPETGAYIQEAPMQPADWQLPMFRAEETKNEATGAKPSEPPPFVIETFIKQCAADIESEEKMKGHFDTVREMKVPAYASLNFKKGFALFKSHVQDVVDANQPPEGGAAENGQGKTSVGAALDKAASNQSVAPIILDLTSDDYAPKGLIAAFKNAAKQAQWNPAQINVLRDELLKKGEDVEAMKDLLRPYVKTASTNEAPADPEQEPGESGLPE